MSAYLLTDDELSNVLRVAAKDHHHKWPVMHNVANAAYNLGIQRGRMVKPLVWEWVPGLELWRAGVYRVYSLHESLYSGCIVRNGMNDWLGLSMPEDEAKVVCEAHYEQSILSVLETV